MKSRFRLTILAVVSVCCFSCHDAVENETVSPPPLVATAPVSVLQKDSTSLMLLPVIEKLAKEDIQSGGFKVLSFRIDSLSWQPGSMKDFYVSRLEKFQQSKVQAEKVFAKMKQDRIVIDAAKRKDDSVKANHAEAVLKELLLKNDNTRSLYIVNYKVVGQTNAVRYNQFCTKFIAIKDMQEVKIKF